MKHRPLPLVFPFVAILLAAAISAPPAAGEERQTAVSAAVSPDGTALALSDPTRRRTVVYRRSANENLLKLWSIDGFFPQVWVWNGGGLLVACPGELVDAVDGSLVVFEAYALGEKVGWYELQELLDDVHSLEQRGSQYYWGQCRGFDDKGNFEVVTVENVPFVLELEAPPPPEAAAGPSADEIAAAMDALEGEGGPRWQASIDYGRSLAEMIKEAELDQVDPTLTAERFPVEQSGTVTVVFDLVSLGRAASGEQAAQALEKLGHRPANLAELLAFATRYPEEIIRRNAIVALGTSWRIKGDAFVPYLEGKSVTSTRLLRIQSTRVTWVDSTYYLVILESE
jgi:hypothetical protein